MSDFEQWVEVQYRYAARAMMKCISRTDLVKSRPGFGSSVRASKGSIIASPVLADWDPEPDYFFHWFRDSAVIIDALRLLYEAQDIGAEALEHLQDFVRFGLSLHSLDGRALVSAPAWRANVSEDFLRFLRQDVELSLVHGSAVVAETRVNPDGTLDISSWTRPQHDGAPLRALALLRWARLAPVDKELSALILSDLAFTHRFWAEPAYDMWEEEQGLHYHTLCVSAAALAAGAQWLQSSGNAPLAETYRAESQTILQRLDEFWLPGQQFYRSRILPSGTRSPKDLDIAVVFAAIHALLEGPAHSVKDPRVHGTLQKLEALFDARYPINRNRAAGTSPAMGRYDGDVYFSGGAYYFSTLGAAELCFRAAASSADPGAWIQRGDGYLATVRAFTPASGEMSEQFDQRTGEQTSARHLGWSYAAFISCVQARRCTLRAGEPRNKVS
jgi:glucoamylase